VNSFELEHLGTLDALRTAVSALPASSHNLFASWEWISTWWQHFGGERPLAGTVARASDGRPLAVVPLYLFSRSPLRVVRFIGHGAGDWLGPISAPGDEQLAADALHATLAAGNGWDLLLAERLRCDQAPARLLGGTVFRREGFPILPFRERTWGELLAQRSANFRQQVRRRERRLARTRNLSYRLCSDPERLDADLELLFALHDARWTQRQSSAFGHARQAFHRNFARLALARGWLRLWVMELDGKPVAAWYGFRHAGVEWYYQSGRDPAYDRDAVGFVLLCHTIRSAVEDGMHAYWFLRGGEAYKDRFAEEDPGLETIASARTQRGRAAITATRALDRLPGAGRRLLRARLG
jgi:CelD/BcsL family acetyltransferase involved in cellulose biosynthesis